MDCVHSDNIRSVHFRKATDGSNDDHLYQASVDDVQEIPTQTNCQWFVRKHYLEESGSPNYHHTVQHTPQHLIRLCLYLFSNVYGLFLHCISERWLQSHDWWLSQSEVVSYWLFCIFTLFDDYNGSDIASDVHVDEANVLIHKVVPRRLEPIKVWDYTPCNRFLDPFHSHGRCRLHYWPPSYSRA